MAPLAAPLAAATLALFLLGRLLDTLSPAAPIPPPTQHGATSPIATALAHTIGTPAAAPTAAAPLQLTPHPALDRTRPLNHFGDAAP